MGKISANKRTKMKTFHFWSIMYGHIYFSGEKWHEVGIRFGSLIFANMRLPNLVPTSHRSGENWPVAKSTYVAVSMELTGTPGISFLRGVMTGGATAPALGMVDGGRDHWNKKDNTGQNKCKFLFSTFSICSQDIHTHMEWNLYKATTKFCGFSRQVVFHDREN